MDKSYLKTLNFLNSITTVKTLFDVVRILKWKWVITHFRQIHIFIFNVKLVAWNTFVTNKTNWGTGQYKAYWFKCAFKIQNIGSNLKQ